MDCDVLVIGAGPVGLMLGSELRLGGVRVVVLDSLETPSPFSKAMGIQGRGIDVLELRGLLGRFTAEGKLANAGHFARLPLAVDRLPEPKPRMMLIHQARVEALLAARATELGVEVRRGQQLKTLTQDETGVTAELESGQRLRARYLVGCDGGRSTVRKQVGIAFPGEPAQRLMRLGDVKFRTAPPERWPLGMGVPAGNGFIRIMTTEPYPADFDRDAPMTIEELTQSVKRTTGLDFELSEAAWLSRSTDASRQAAEYRKGRVFLAGDAAHVHLPAGGPGIATGINDAVNLGWKLAAEVNGWAPDGLLDTYHSERHPAGARVLQHTRAQSALTPLGPNANLTALREILQEVLALEPAMRLVTDILSGADLRYALGDPTDAVGRWSTKGIRVNAAAKGQLVDGSADGYFARAAEPWSARVEIIRDSGHPTALIRPDGYVAWASHSARPLEVALAQWFGS